MLCEVNVRDGRERAAASVLDVVEEEDWFVVVGDAATSDLPTAPAAFCLGRFCRFSCKALARAFSCLQSLRISKVTSG